jgi:two-component system KDP operon response regulator KdpE
MLEDKPAGTRGAEFVWLLEHEPPIQRLITLVVELEGMTPVICNTAEQLLSAVHPAQNGVVILDIGMPDDAGLALIAGTKTDPSRPVLAMSATGYEVASLAMRSGADDFVEMPFDPDDIATRVKFLLGRPEPALNEEGVYGTDTLRLDLQARTLTDRQEEVRLSKTEWEILRILAKQAGQPVLRSEIARGAFGHGPNHDGEHFDVLIERLHQKLGCDPAKPSILLPIHQIAYKLNFTTLEA